MVSLKQARAWQTRLAAGETVQLQAHVEARRHVGQYDIVTARIRGADPASQIRRSRSAATWTIRIPERTTTRAAARRYWKSRAAIAKLIREGRLARPARTMRFIWPPEIEGSTILLNARPDLAARIAAVVHMDMVGGGPETKAVFHVTRSPASLPDFRQ